MVFGGCNKFVSRSPILTILRSFTLRFVTGDDEER